jgi:hypothetical protein
MTNGTSRYLTYTTASGQSFTTATNVNSWTSGLKVMTIGSSINDSSSESSNSYIGEVIYYTAALSTWQRQIVEGYLAWKWSIASGLPDDHPFSVTAPTYEIYNWNPIATTVGLGLWLDSSDANTIAIQANTAGSFTDNSTNPASQNNISFWYDKSSNMVHYTNLASPQRQPKYELDIVMNKFGVAFDGNSSNFPALAQYNASNQSPFANSSYWTIITVHRNTGTSRTNTGYLYYNSEVFYRYWDILSVHGTSNTISGLTSGPASAVSGIGCTISNNANLYYYLNGTNFLTTTKATNALTYNSSLVIGNINTAGNSSDPYRGYIFEFIVFRSALPDTKRQQVEGYLAHKWNLAANLSASHPFKLAAPIEGEIVLPNTISGCTLWLDGQDLTTLWQNVAGTVSITTVGQSVNYWSDKSGANNHMTTSGLSVTAPLWTYNGVNFGATSNVSKMISITTPAKSLNNTIFIVLTPVTTSNANTTVFSHQNSTDSVTNVFSVKGNTAATSFGIYSNGAQRAPVTTTVNNRTILYGTLTSGTTYAFQAVSVLSGTLSASTTSTASITTAAGPIYIGSDEGTNWSNAVICEVIYYQSILTSKQIWNNLEYLGNKWGPSSVVPTKLISTAATWLPLASNTNDIGQTTQTRLTSGVTFTTYRGEQCAYFDGNTSSTYISLPFTGGNLFTISYWCSVFDTSNYAPWSINELNGVSSTGNFGIDVNINNNVYSVQFNYTTGSTTAPSFTLPTAVGNWNFLTLTLNKTTNATQFYCNGILQGSTFTPSGRINSPNFLILGKSATGRGFKGHLRHFMVFNSILTQSEIQNTMIMTEGY